MSKILQKRKIRSFYIFFFYGFLNQIRAFLYFCDMIPETALGNLHRLMIAIREEGILESHPVILNEYRRIQNCLGYDPGKITRINHLVSTSTHPEYKDAYFLHLNPEE